MLDPEDYGLTPVATLAHVAGTTPPPGFDAFWARAMGQLHDDAPETELVERTTPDPTDASCTHEFRSLGGVRIGCGLFVPDAARAHPPVRAGLVTLHGAGVPRTIAEEHDRWRRLVAKGVAVLAIRVRGFPGSNRDVPELIDTPPEHWATVGLDHHEHEDHALTHWSVVGAALDTVAACVAMRRWLDMHVAATGPAPLMLRGESLGGGLATIGAALLERHCRHNCPIDRLSIGLPTFGDWRFRAKHPGYGQGRSIADVIVRARERGEEIHRRLRFCDAAVHATRIHTPVFAKLAIRDEVVPAPAAAAVINAFATPASRRWRFLTPFGHHEGGIAHARREAMFERCLLDFLDPALEPPEAMRRWLPLLETGDRPPTQQPLAQPESEAKTAALFGSDDESNDPSGLSPFDRAVLDEYRRVGRTLDDLPYTEEFESLYTASFAHAHNRTRREVFHRLHNLRKAGKLPRAGRSKVARPVIDQRDEQTLIELVTLHAGTLGQRDRLPYTPEMDRLAETFRERTAQDIGLHELWRLIAKLAK